MMENPTDFYYGVLWNKLCHRDLVKEHRLRMNLAISWCEDFMFNLEYIHHARHFLALQVPIYYYVKTTGSLIALKCEGLLFDRFRERKLLNYYLDAAAPKNGLSLQKALLLLCLRQAPPSARRVWE